MDLKEIKQIIELMTKNELSHFHLERDGMKIKLKKGMDSDALSEQLSALQAAAAPAPVAAAPAIPATAPGGPPPAAPAAASGSAGADAVFEDFEPPADGEIEITSPMVGTFYASSAPDSPAFAEVGASVKVGSVICIVEAMKVMNEIKSEHSGTITRIIAENGTPVQYGEPLFHLRPS